SSCTCSTASTISCCARATRAWSRRCAAGWSGISRRAPAPPSRGSAVPLVRGLPEGASLAELRGAYAVLFDKLRPYGQALMRGPSPCPPGERELIAAYVSGVNACRYCFGVHSRVAAAFGVDAKVFDALMSDPDGAPVDARLKPVLRYARKLTET